MRIRPSSCARLIRTCKKRAATTLSLALLAPAVFATIADAQEYCVGGCVWGVNCPTQPHPEAGRVELPLCVDPVGPGGPGQQETSPTPAIVEDERGEATGTSTGTLYAKIDSQGYGVRSIEWQYDSEVDIFSGEVSLPPDPAEVSGGSEIEGSALGPISNSAALSSLEPDTSYFFRVVVYSRDGALTDGPLESFRTPAISEPSPSSTTKPISTSPSSTGTSTENGERSPGSSTQTLQPTGQSPAPPAPYAQTTTSIATTPTSPVRTVDPHLNELAAGTSPPRQTRTLNRALKACRARPASRRSACIRRAERLYSPRQRR